MKLQRLLILALAALAFVGLGAFAQEAPALKFEVVKENPITSIKNQNQAYFSQTPI